MITRRKVLFALVVERIPLDQEPLYLTMHHTTYEELYFDGEQDSMYAFDPIKQTLLLTGKPMPMIRNTTLEHGVVIVRWSDGVDRTLTWDV